MTTLSPPPSREKLPVVNGQAEMPRTWLRWFTDLAANVTDAASSQWAAISKTGSNLTDLEVRRHQDLQNLNTASYHHLTEANHTDLTDGGDSALHYHATDRDLSNATGQLTLDHLATMQAFAAAHG